MYQSDEVEVYATNATNDPMEWVYLADDRETLAEMHHEDISLGQCRDCGSGGYLHSAPDTYLPDYGYVDDGHVITGHRLVSAGPGTPYVECAWCGVKSFVAWKRSAVVVF